MICRENLPLAQLLSAHAIGAGGLGSNPRSVKSAQSRQRLATAAMVLWSCVAQALSHGDGPRNSLHASAQYRELLMLVTVNLLHAVKKFSSRKIVTFSYLQT